jgi:hypothetical protein
MRSRGLKPPRASFAIGANPLPRLPGCIAWVPAFTRSSPEQPPFLAIIIAPNEEAIYVIEGEGTLRVGDSETPVRPGDFISLPRGREHVHRLDNHSQRPLRYLCFSTMIEPDIAVYSDSNKVGFFAGSAPGGPKEKRRLTGIYRRDTEVGYFDGEPDA